VRGIKTTTISILAIGLLAGSAVGAAAQDGTMAPASVTGTVSSVSDDSDGTTVFADGVAVIE
jgi:hypothetical protein